MCWRRIGDRAARPADLPPIGLLLFGAGHVPEPLCQGGRPRRLDVRRHRRPCRAGLAAASFPAARRILVEGAADAIDGLELEAEESYVGSSPTTMCSIRASSKPCCAGLFLSFDRSERKREMFRKRLSAQGFTSEALDRIATPVGGLDIDAETPAEIAVSIVAELIAGAARTGRASS